MVRSAILACAATALLTSQALAAPFTIFSDDFESYTGAATALTDTQNANPANPAFEFADDNPVGSPAGSGVQLIDWARHGGSQALLLRSGTTLNVNLPNTHSGSSYTLDFWAYVNREATTDRGFRIALQGEGADYNGNDFLVYRVVVATNNTALEYYDGVAGTGAWKPAGASLTANTWQHHRVVIDPNALTFSLYLDDMTTPVLSGADIARPEVAMPTRFVLQHEGNTADDGYYVVDDLSLTVEGSIDLSTPFVEGFESYPARTSLTDDADPGGPWITTEVDGTGNGKDRAPVKVQVVGADSGVTPHSGSKCLKLEYGQRAGATVAWGTPPQKDVQITWWARVPASQVGGQYTYLRMSLYGAENGSTYGGGDAALLGYGARDATTGDSTSLTYYTSTWVDTGVDYTPDTWEEYRLTTHTGMSSYTIVKNPSSANPQTVVEKKPMIGTSPFGPIFMAAWSSSNGTNHPPVYVDDIEIKAVNASPDLTQVPYSVNLDGNRFTNYTTLSVPGLAGAVAVDPRDNSTIIFAIEEAAGAGGIFRATKVSSGNWAVDPKPLVSGLSNPSGLTVAGDGTIWWTHDINASVMRLKWPWTNNTPEELITDFGMLSPTNTFQDDDTFDIVVPPAGFTGSIGNPGQVVIMDRGVDNNADNALFVLDASTTQTNQQAYSQYLYGPTPTGLGAADLVALTALPPSEVATLSLDGQVTAVDANGSARSFWPDFYADPSIPIQPSAMAFDPVTSRLWIADDLTNQIWSVSPTGTGGTRQVSFVVTNAAWPELSVNFAEPGMAFSKDGSILVVSDESPLTGQGRLIVLHNEANVPSLQAFKITSYRKTDAGFEITWQGAANVKYRVQRTTNLSTPMVDITGDLTGTSFTDTNVSGNAFYRVVAQPQ